MSAPMHSSDAESGVLGALLYLANYSDEETARDAILTVREKLPPEAFYFSGHRTLYEIVFSLAENRRPFDTITLAQQIRDAGLHDIGGEVGGSPCVNADNFLIALGGFVPGPNQLTEHASIVHKKFLRRQIEAAAQDTLRRVREEQDQDVRALLDETQARMLAISERSTLEETFRLPKAGVQAAMEKLESAYDNRGGISGLPAGLVDLDRQTTGWKPQQMIIVAGSTGMGKTSLMLQFAAYLIFECDLPVAFFSLEMSYEELVERLVYSRAKVSLQRARDGHLSDDALKRFSAACAETVKARLYVDDFAGLNIFEYRARARRAVKKFGAAAIFGDYLQLFDDAGNGREDNRVQELQRISRGIKLTAKELGVPNFVGAQLNSKPDERKSSVVVNPFKLDEETNRPIRVQRYGVPQLSDLRECKAIAMDADLVLFPYRPWYFSKLDEDRVGKHIEWAQIIVGKQRNGPVGPVHVRFIDDETRFETIPSDDGTPRETLYSTAVKARQPGYEPKHA